MSKKIDTEKRKTPAHSRSFSQPAQPLSKLVQDGADSTHRKQRTKSEILRAPLQGILKRRPNGAVNATNSGICTSTQTECVNLNSNNNYHQKYSLSLPSRRMKGSRVPTVRLVWGPPVVWHHATSPPVAWGVIPGISHSSCGVGVIPGINHSSCGVGVIPGINHSSCGVGVTRYQPLLLWCGVGDETSL